MDKMRQLSLLTAVAILAVVAGGWLLLISPQRSKVTDLHDQAAQQQEKNATLSTEIARLKAEAKDLPAEQARLAAIAEQLPANPAMPALLDDLSSAAKKSGVDLQIITPQTPVAYDSTASTLAAPTASAAPGSASTAASGTSSTSTSSTSSSTTSSTTTGTTPAPSSSATSSSTSTSTTSSGAATLAGAGTASASGLFQIPMSLTAVGTYYQLTQFLNQLENLQRAYLVTGVDVKPGDPLASALSTATTQAAGAAATTGDGYTSALTATIDGFVFEVLTSAPSTTAQTLPSTSSGN
jgi:Tfp pilus assembly protein PilO